MQEAAVYQDMLTKMTVELSNQMSEVPVTRLYERPGPQQNSVGWNYWHMLRIWDYWLNHMIGGEDPSRDAWHRHDFSTRSGYNPDGTGAREAGLGMGQTDDEVDEVRVEWELLMDYQRVLLEESIAFLDNVRDENAFERAIPTPANPSQTISVRDICQQMIRQGWMHYGEMRYAKGMIGFPDVTYPGRAT